MISTSNSCNFFVTEPILIIFGALISSTRDLFISGVFQQILKNHVSLKIPSKSHFSKIDIHIPTFGGGGYTPPRPRPMTVESHAAALTSTTYGTWDSGCYSEYCNGIRTHSHQAVCHKGQSPYKLDAY